MLVSLFHIFRLVLSWFWCLPWYCVSMLLDFELASVWTHPLLWHLYCSLDCMPKCLSFWHSYVGQSPLLLFLLYPVIPEFQSALTRGQYHLQSLDLLFPLGQPIRSKTNPTASLLLNQTLLFWSCLMILVMWYIIHMPATPCFQCNEGISTHKVSISCTETGKPVNSRDQSVGHDYVKVLNEAEHTASCQSFGLSCLLPVFETVPFPEAKLAYKICLSIWVTAPFSIDKNTEHAPCASDQRNSHLWYAYP